MEAPHVLERGTSAVLANGTVVTYVPGNPRDPHDLGYYEHVRGLIFETVGVDGTLILERAAAQVRGAWWRVARPYPEPEWAAQLERDFERVILLVSLCLGVPLFLAISVLLLRLALGVR